MEVRARLSSAGGAEFQSDAVSWMQIAPPFPGPPPNGGIWARRNAVGLARQVAILTKPSAAEIGNLAAAVAHGRRTCRL